MKSFEIVYNSSRGLGHIGRDYPSQKVPRSLDYDIAALQTARDNKDRRAAHEEGRTPWPKAVYATSPAPPLQEQRTVQQRHPSPHSPKLACPWAEARARRGGVQAMKDGGSSCNAA